MSLSRPLTESDLRGKSVLHATLVASRSDVVDTGATIILVSIPVTTPAPVPSFEKSSYQGSLNEQLELSIENLILSETTYGPDVTFKLNGGNHFFL